MASITTRAGKGSPLTNAELDANFNNINAGITTAAAVTGGTINNVSIDNSGIGTTVASTGAFTSVTSTSVAGVVSRVASAQDGVALVGRGGGTSSYKVTLTPAALSADRTLTLPDASGTVLHTGTTVTVAQGGTGLTAGTSGGVPYYSGTGTLASSAALAASSLVVGGGAGAAPSTITTGTGVTTALGVNTGTAGAFVVNGDALGTPASGTLTNATGLPIDAGTTGTLPVSRGGTGQTVLGGGYILRGNATGGVVADTELSWGNPGAPNNTRQINLVAPTSGIIAGSCGISVQAANTTGGGNSYISLVPRASGVGSVGTTINANLELIRNGSAYVTYDANGVKLASGRNLGLGNTSPSTSGTGITFPATQSASSNANTLDDYEEGTFTPVIAGSTTTGTGTYNVYGQVGVYVKIGNLVKVQIRLNWSAHTGSGDMSVTGLPFNSPSSIGYNDAVAITCSNITLTANNVMTADKLPYANAIQIRQYPVGGGAQTNVTLDTSGEIQLSCVYMTTT